MKQETTIGFKSHWFTLLLAVLVLTFVTNVLAGGKEPPPPMQIHYTSNGNVNNPVITDGPVQIPKSAKETELEKQLDAARLSGNIVSAKYLEQQLDNLRGHVQVYQQETRFPAREFSMNEKPAGEISEYDYSLASIHNFSIYSHAFGIAPSGSPIAGRLFYLLSQDASTGADSLKIMYSTNNGVSWVNLVWFGVNGYSFNNDEMDIEIVYDGTNTWIFGVVGFLDQTDGRKKAYFFRRNATTSDFYGTILNFPGSGAGMNYYNPRITSDNSNFTSNAYVMILCSMDSLAGSNHYVKQKYVLSSSPFAAVPSFNYAQPSGTSGFYWSASNGTNANTYLYGDIAYYKDDGGSGENRIMTIYGNYGSIYDDIYIAYLNGYSSYGGSSFVDEPNVNRNMKLAFNGGSNNRNGMITYMRHFSGADWDIFGIRTTNGGSSWTRDTIDYSTDRARNCDLISVRNASNQFRLTYTQDNSSNSNNPTAYFRNFNGTAWSTGLIYSNNKVDTVFAKPRAGYILGGGDDGAGVWSSIGGYNGFFAKQIMTTTGITTNNEIPSGFSLSQNYPNPFNPVTNIKFSIPKAGLVTLKVYDITGKEVAQLVNQNMNAGVYTFDFDASSLSSGAYFYRISTDGFTDVKKMMLVK